MPQPVGIQQLIVWKDLLIALTTADEIWILRGLNVWPHGTERVPLEWVKVEATVAPQPEPTLLLTDETGAIVPTNPDKPTQW